MALLARLKALFARTSPQRLPGTRQATTAAKSADVPRESTLRKRLVEDPNDVAAFRELAELVRRRADSVDPVDPDRKSTRLNSSHVAISYAVFCLKNKSN